jgi:glucose/arabinose dehydrogenase
MPETFPTAAAPTPHTRSTLARAMAPALIGVAALAGLTMSSALASAQTLASVPVVTSGLTRPLYVASPPGDNTRLFIVEQRFNNVGRIKVLNLVTGVVSGTIYLEVSPVSTGGEQGLLGLAFHPNFMQNGYFYVNYTIPAQAGVSAGSTIIAQYRASGGNPMATTADPASAHILLTIPQSDANHNGGWLDFGPDGYLYIATGDGGNANDQNGQFTELAVGHTPNMGNAQDITDNLLGKMLRIDVDGPDNIPGNADDADPGTGKPYRIPADNPFVGITGDDEIWSYGLRNPWRCSFDRETGDLWMGDVGQGVREEINLEPAGVGGRNYGWRCMEGTRCTGLSGCTCNSVNLTMPILVYDHLSNRCSVTGGYVYRGCAISELRGTYFYGDYCSREILSFRRVGNQNTQLTSRTAQLAPPGFTLGEIISFGEDNLGELYIVDRSGTSGRIFRIVAATPNEPDCNANGVPDACDIARGTSQDTNNNGIPDECEPPCYADFNQDGGIDGADVEAFYLAWEVGDPSADVNQDGGVDGQDVETFFIAWESGEC